MFIIFSLLLSAFFSGMEIAYVSSNRLDLEIEKNKSGLIPKILSIITQNPSRFIATMLIGNNFVLVIYGIFMGQFIIDNIPFIDLASINEFSALLIQTFISTFLILIAAEFIPKVLFQIYSNLSMKVFSIPAYIFYILLYPITSLVTADANLDMVDRLVRIDNRPDAEAALEKLDTVVDQVNENRATMGAVMNRLTYAIDTLTNVSMNQTESRSRVLDADYAMASTELARTQIIQQAATAMLAQANQQPQIVLALLQ